MIKSFKINKLFGFKDVFIPFEADYKILIGENGIGKTQVLNLFYYTLTKQFSRLKDYNFESIEFDFGEQSVKVLSEDIEEFFKVFYKHPVLQQVISKIGLTEFNRLRNEILHSKRSISAKYILQKNRVIRSIAPAEYIVDLIRSIDLSDVEDDSSEDNPINNCKAIIGEYISEEIMYFPTYRRVEEDLHNLGYSEEDIEIDSKNLKLINFGMDDVQSRFDYVQSTINQFLKEGLAQFTKDILNVVIEDDEPQSNILDKIDEEDLNIILSRIGGLLPETQKDAVRNIVASRKLKNPLSAYLLQKLADIYEKQKELDNSIKQFRDVCNKYLINKEVYYDESAIKIFVKLTYDNKEIDLSKLSSGEKQIISIFSKIYLSGKDKRFIVLFDEPELSLSMLWQRQLLPDIIDSGKCKFLLAVTHSPFIFDNELDSFAFGLNEYVHDNREQLI